MTKHTLFVCKSCSATIAHDDATEETITEGALLLNQLQQLNQKALLNRNMIYRGTGTSPKLR